MLFDVVIKCPYFKCRSPPCYPTNFFLGIACLFFAKFQDIFPPNYVSARAASDPTVNTHFFQQISHISRDPHIPAKIYQVFNQKFVNNCNSGLQHLKYRGL